MRQIILDTETTGLDTAQGHRIIEIGCIELIDRQFTGNTFHQYINPQRKVEEAALSIHGLTNNFLADKPTFSNILNTFLEFINGAELIAHNASFDVGFINYEMQLIDTNARLLNDYVAIFDTLILARKMFPGQHNNLNALCKRYKIDLSSRTLHGALLDAKLLAEVYLMMTCGQSSLFSETENSLSDNLNKTTKKATSLLYADEQESIAHKMCLEKIKQKTGKHLWED
jgi:DNA polymerase-3 subunit epsilon